MTATETSMYPIAKFKALLLQTMEQVSAERSARVGGVPGAGTPRQLDFVLNELSEVLSLVDSGAIPRREKGTRRYLASSWYIIHDWEADWFAYPVDAGMFSAINALDQIYRDRLGELERMVPADEEVAAFARQLTPLPPTGQMPPNLMSREEFRHLLSSVVTEFKLELEKRRAGIAGEGTTAQLEEGLRELNELGRTVEAEQLPSPSARRLKLENSLRHGWSEDWDASNPRGLARKVSELCEAYRHRV